MQTLGKYRAKNEVGTGSVVDWDGRLWDTENCNVLGHELMHKLNRLSDIAGRFTPGCFKKRFLTFNGKYLIINSRLFCQSWGGTKI